MAINYYETPEFQKDFKKLSKRYRSLPDDLEVAKKGAIELYHLNKLDNRSVFQIPEFCFGEIKIFKLKKFSCKALKGRGVMSGIRVIYSFIAGLLKVTFIEIYFKGDKENEDRSRIKEFLKIIKK